MRAVTDVCRSGGGKCPGLGPSFFGMRVRTLPMFVGVVVVSSILLVLMFWSESKYAALMELLCPRRSVGRKW